MLLNSYQVQALDLKHKIKGLELDLLKNPDNQRARKKKEELQKELDWFEKRIREGKDPGVRIE